MKIKRHKHTKRVLKYYETNFGIDTVKDGVTILVDGTFANEALKSKINLADQLPTFFNLVAKKCRIVTSKCAVRETELLGKPTYGAMLILKQYETVECSHKRQFVHSEKCIKNILLGAKDKSAEKINYFVATQVTFRTPSLLISFICFEVLLFCEEWNFERNRAQFCRRAAAHLVA